MQVDMTISVGKWRLKKKLFDFWFIGLFHENKEELSIGVGSENGESHTISILIAHKLK